MSFLVFLTLSREILMYIQNLDWFIWGSFFHSVSVKANNAVNREQKVVVGIKILFLYKTYACKSKNKLGCISIVNVHTSQDTLMHIFSTIGLLLLTCPILLMCLHLIWSFIVLYIQSRNAFHTFFN